MRTACTLVTGGDGLAVEGIINSFVKDDKG
jgi:hypothetical protein